MCMLEAQKGQPVLQLALPACVACAYAPAAAALLSCGSNCVPDWQRLPISSWDHIQHTRGMVPGPVCQQQQMRQLPSQGEQLKQTPCRVLYEDSANNVFMWDERGSLIAIPDFTGPLETAVWALDMPGIFALSDVLQLHLYAYLPNTLSGPGDPGLTQ